MGHGIGILSPTRGKYLKNREKSNNYNMITR
jgi:hypothetical protein